MMVLVSIFQNFLIRFYVLTLLLIYNFYDQEFLMNDQKINILAIESSCDDTAAAVLCNGKILSNIVATQEVHRQYGGVVPELASRAHQQNIVPVIHQALAKANIDKKRCFCNRLYPRSRPHGFFTRGNVFCQVSRNGTSCAPNRG